MIWLVFMYRSRPQTGKDSIFGRCNLICSTVKESGHRVKHGGANWTVIIKITASLLSSYGLPARSVDVLSDAAGR
jgi:hypothetical protein